MQKLSIWSQLAQCHEVVIIRIWALCRQIFRLAGAVWNLSVCARLHDHIRLSYLQCKRDIFKRMVILICAKPLGGGPILIGSPVSRGKWQRSNHQIWPSRLPKGSTEALQLRLWQLITIVGVARYPECGLFYRREEAWFSFATAPRMLENHFSPWVNSISSSRNLPTLFATTVAVLYPASHESYDTLKLRLSHFGWQAWSLGVMYYPIAGWYAEAQGIYLDEFILFSDERLWQPNKPESVKLQ